MGWGQDRDSPAGGRGEVRASGGDHGAECAPTKLPSTPPAEGHHHQHYTPSCAFLCAVPPACLCRAVPTQAEAAPAAAPAATQVMSQEKGYPPPGACATWTGRQASPAARAVSPRQVRPPPLPA